MANIDYDFVLNYATKKHDGQFRADGVTPYINHCIKVAELVKKYKRSQNIDSIVAACLLHDTLEDTYTSYKELEDVFGEMVASMVMEVTTATYMTRLVGKGNYLKHKMKEMSQYALVIKLADRLANIYDSNNLPKERRLKLIRDTDEIVDFLERNRELTVAQKSILKEIKIQIDKIKEIYYK